MIYTLTFSPSLDYYLEVPNFKVGNINRSQSEELVAGGKGINVSLILKELNIESIAMGFIAGFVGEELVRRLNEKAIKTDFVKTVGHTRINVKINSQRETAINANSPKISSKEISQLSQKLSQLKANDILSIGGNIPQTFPKSSYIKILTSLQQRNIKFIVDATNDFLVWALPFHPFLIKPNREELEEIFKQKLDTPDEIIEKALLLKKKGAQNVIVSLGKDGAIMIDKNDKIYIKKAAKGKMKSSVGAGDSLIAGFIAGYSLNQNAEEALEWGIAAGSATAFSFNLASREDIIRIHEQLINNH